MILNDSLANRMQSTANAVETSRKNIIKALNAQLYYSGTSAEIDEDIPLTRIAENIVPSPAISQTASMKYLKPFTVESAFTNQSWMPGLTDEESIYLKHFDIEGEEGLAGMDTFLCISTGYTKNSTGGAAWWVPDSVAVSAGLNTDDKQVWCNYMDEHASTYEITEGDLPAGFVQLDYIQTTSTNQACINTGIVGKSSLKIEIKAQYYNVRASSHDFLLYGATDYDREQNTFECYGWDNNLELDYGAEKRSVIAGNFGNTYGGKDILLIHDKNKYTISSPNNEFTTISGEFTEQTFTTTVAGGELILFGIVRYTAGYREIVRSQRTRMYYCKIWDDEVLVRDFVPVKRSDNVFGFYDLVEGKFYSNYNFGGVETNFEGSAYNIDGIMKDCTTGMPSGSVLLCGMPDATNTDINVYEKRTRLIKIDNFIEGGYFVWGQNYLADKSATNPVTYLPVAVAFNTHHLEKPRNITLSGGDSLSWYAPKDKLYRLTNHTIGMWFGSSGWPTEKTFYVTNAEENKIYEPGWEKYGDVWGGTGWRCNDDPNNPPNIIIKPNYTIYAKLVGVGTESASISISLKDISYELPDFWN